MEIFLFMKWKNFNVAKKNILIELIRNVYQKPKELT